MHTAWVYYLKHETSSCNKYMLFIEVPLLWLAASTEQSLCTHCNTFQLSGDTELQSKCHRVLNNQPQALLIETSSSCIL